MSIPGARINRKLVIFESDDWGAERIPNKEIREKLIDNGLIDSKNKFNLIDTLESSDDLVSLFDLLSKYRDCHGKTPIITTNFLTANPDFEQIKRNNFEEYAYESFLKTYERRDGNNKIFKFIQEGKENGFIKPQFHGREHIHVNQWMRRLKINDSVSRKSFDYRVFCLDDKGGGHRDNLMAAFDYQLDTEVEQINDIFKSGYEQFEDVFGFKSVSMIAPCYVWGSNIEEISQNLGVKYIQGIFNQYIPTFGDQKYRLKWHFTGDKNKFGQRYLVRNAFLEVFENDQIDHVDECLKRIEIAFRWGKPAIIGTHRINFVGGLDEKNRTNFHKKLEELIKKMLQKWPDLEFISTDQLENYL